MRRPWLPLITAALVLTGCSGEGSASKEGQADATSTTAGKPSTLDVQVASYDLVTGRPQRVLLGVVASGGRVLAGGEIEVHFAHLGEGTGSSATGIIGEPHQATFQSIVGTPPPDGGPRVSRPSEGVGVYAIPAATFDKAGQWGVIAKIKLGTTEVTAQGTFPVSATSRIPAPGVPAPVTEHPLPGATGTSPASIDSRSTDGKAPPDGALHSTTIAAARAAGRPMVVVVSTPVYCVSRFCGPITDSVEKLAGRFGDRATFIHLEVWQDFEKKQVNEFVADWIYPSRSGDLLEPWVFVVDRNGVITHRFDNIAGDAELLAAVEQVVA